MFPLTHYGDATYKKDCEWSLQWPNALTLSFTRICWSCEFLFSERKFAHAIDLYTQAIELNGQNAVYLANRAFAHLRLEEYGSAILDATKAIEVDPKYSKVLQLLKL